MKLQGKTALVTGAGHGIGRTIALELARDGAKVVVNYPFERVEATELVSEIDSFGGEAIAVRADVSKDVRAGEDVREDGPAVRGAGHTG